MSRDFFKWDNDFNTGNNIIDYQHFGLVEIINELLELSLHNNLVELDKIINISTRLSLYVNEHFSTEENLMDKYLVDERHVKEHKQSHSDFKKELAHQFSDPEKLLNSKQLNYVLEYLIRWLVYHILNTDKNLVRQISYITEDRLSPFESFEKEERINELSTEPLLKALKFLYTLVLKKSREIESKNIELEEKVRLRTAELSKANEKLSQMLFQDVLTGLPNRRYVMDELEKLINNWKRYNVPFSILFIDVDKFKFVNDTYGHENGDKLLKWISVFLNKHIRNTDVACRLGGDEFVIICSNTDKNGAITLGQKLNKLCTENPMQQFKFWKPSLSIGVASISKNITSPSELLKKADESMYLSKSKGGGITSSI